MWQVWANKLLPKALKSCPKSNKSPNLVTLQMSNFYLKRIWAKQGTNSFCWKTKHFFNFQKVWHSLEIFLQNVAAAAASDVDAGIIVIRFEKIFWCQRFLSSCPAAAAEHHNYYPCCTHQGTCALAPIKVSRGPRVTRLGEFCTLGNFFKPLTTINLPKSLTFLGNFRKAVKILNLRKEKVFLFKNSDQAE